LSISFSDEGKSENGKKLTIVSNSIYIKEYHKIRSLHYAFFTLYTAKL